MKKARKTILIVIIVTIVTIGIHVLNALTFGSIVKYSNHIINLEENNKQLHGYKITFISDIHEISKKEYENIVNHINEKIQPNMAILGGDYFSNAMDDEVFKVTAKINTKDGIYGVLGNHDIYEYTKILMDEENINLLANSGKSFENGLYLAGVKDLYSEQANIEKAVKNAREDEFVLLISHNPDIIMEQPMDKVDFTLSGHTHGGQITFFNIWAPALKFVSGYGQRFKSGLCENEYKDKVYVSSGVGSFNSIPRIFAQPEVVTIEFNF